MKRAKQIILFVAGSILAWFLLARWIPFPDDLLDRPPENTRLLDREGRPLRRILARDGMDRSWVGLTAAGNWAPAALISVEDQRFYSHFGLDPVAVIRAVGQNLFAGRVVSGASTLSTQVIRMARPRPRNLVIKLVEAFRATQMELRYDKGFILEQYLNRAPMGGNREGVLVGARRYFGKEPEGLSAGEAALLMGLPQSPSRFRPDRYAYRAERRRKTVLRRMREEGVLYQDPLLSTGRRYVEPELKAFPFTEWVRRRGVGSGDQQTTLDPLLQRTCEAVVAGVRRDLPYRDADGVGVVVMEVKTGAVRAWVGNWDPDHPLHGQVDTVTRRRAPGSTLKPFAYALAMEQGWMTPETRLEDRPLGLRDYRPTNMNPVWSGEVSAEDALIRSLNLPALGVVERVGVARFLGVLRTAGLGLPGVEVEEVGLGSVLGGGMEASLLELVTAFSTFAGKGVGREPVGLKGDEGSPSPLWHAGVAYWISHILSGPQRDGMLYGSHADVKRPAFAFKTGTSHGHRDAWAIGWNDTWVMGVWVGRMDGGSVEGLSGGSHAAPILGKLAAEVMRDAEWPSPPPQLENSKGIPGVTDPQEKSERTLKAKVVSPAPEFTWEGVGAKTARVKFHAVGTEGEQAHWFVNGVWIGEIALNQPVFRPLEPGAHSVRVVFADGRTETRQVRIL